MRNEVNLCRWSENTVVQKSVDNLFRHLAGETERAVGTKKVVADGAKVFAEIKAEAETFGPQIWACLGKTDSDNLKVAFRQWLEQQRDVDEEEDKDYWDKILNVLN